jgi:hypothetical protein
MFGLQGTSYNKYHVEELARTGKIYLIPQTPFKIISELEVEETKDLTI